MNLTHSLKFLITDQNISVFLDGETHLISRTDPNADKLIIALRANDFDHIPKYLSAAKRIEDFGQGSFEVKDGKIFINGDEEPAPELLGNKILKFSDEGLPYQPLIRFWENLKKNPSINATEQLFRFLEKGQFIITNNGNIICYKKVRPDFYDIYSGKFLNTPNSILKMEYSEVEDDSSKLCAPGFHTCSWEYLSHYASALQSIILEIEVNPKDVVSIPEDYNFSKMRVCQYKVLRVVEKEIDEKHFRDLEAI